jgi:SPP1 gp7 family putative phage head morphogenesis protein
MATANEKLLDASTLHAVRIERYKNGIVRRMIAQLNRVDADLVDQLQRQLEKLPAYAVSVERIDKMLASVRDLNAEAYATISKALDGELKELVRYEAGYQQDLFKRVLPVDIDFESVSANQVYAAAMSRPFQGRLLKEWMAGLEAERALKIRDAVRIGVIEGQTIQQITQRIRGTRALNYADGLLDISRRNAEAVVRTAVSHTANFARERVMKENEDLLKGEQFVATLDGRTTPECIKNDGNIYPVGEGPIPPLHFGCRSVRVAVLKSWRELGFYIDELPESTRSSLNGQVPESTTYNEWLRTQPKEIQEEVLGKTRAELYRNNDLSVTSYINNKGEYYTLDELRQRDASLFE